MDASASELVQPSLDAPVKKPRRRWFQYSLRSLLLLTALIAVWLGYEARRVERQRRVVSMVYGFEGTHCEFEPRFFWKTTTEMPGFLQTLADKYPNLFCNVTGIDLTRYGAIIGDEDRVFTDRDGEILATLSTLKKLNVEGVGVSDAWLVHLSELSNLEDLDLSFCPVTDTGLSHLNGLRRLQLSGTRVDNAGLAYLSGMQDLEQLDLLFTSVGDEGLVHLHRLAKLQSVLLEGTNFITEGKSTAEGMGKLKMALPRCELKLVFSPDYDTGPPQ